MPPTTTREHVARRPHRFLCTQAASAFTVFVQRMVYVTRVESDEAMSARVCSCTMYLGVSRREMHDRFVGGSYSAMENAPEVPHSPYLSICNGWGCQWLRHVGIGEQLRLDFEYALKFSDADRGYLVPQSATRWPQESCALPWSLGEACDAGGLVTVWANTLLKRAMHVVAQDGSERFFVRDAKAETSMWVDRIAERHQAFAWMHDCSAVGFSFSVAVWQYTLARAGCCIFWEIVSLQAMRQG